MRLRISAPAPLRTLITAQQKALLLGMAARPVAVLRVTQGLTGSSGASGQAQISADPGNQLTQGSDQRLFVPAPQVTAGDLSYTHQQPQASDAWAITHALGKFPAVTVVDSAGDVVEGDVVYIDANNLQITFSSAFAGLAFLN